MKGLGIFGILLWVALAVGEIKCIVKMFQCNWSPVGYAEMAYTVGTFTGLGCVIGYMDFKDK